MRDIIFRCPGGPLPNLLPTVTRQYDRRQVGSAGPRHVNDSRPSTHSSVLRSNVVEFSLNSDGPERERANTKDKFDSDIVRRVEKEGPLWYYLIGGGF